MSPEVKQQRQTKYREELQAQMKEREMQKKRYVSFTSVISIRQECCRITILPQSHAREECFQFDSTFDSSVPLVLFCNKTGPMKHGFYCLTAPRAGRIFIFLKGGVGKILVGCKRHHRASFGRG